MAKISQSEASRSHVLLLLEQEQYDEALAILSDLREKDPSDREIRIYYLLLLRIFVLRWSLSRAITETSIGRLASVARVVDRLKLIRSFGRSYQPAEKSSANRSAKRFIVAGAGSGFLMILLAFYIIGGSKGESPVSSNMLTSTDASHLTVSASGARTFYPNKPRTAGDDRRQTQSRREADERDFSRLASERSELLPIQLTQDVLKSHLRAFGAQEFTATGIDRAKATPQFDASNALVKRQTAALKIDRSRATAGSKTIGSKALGKTLGPYQSRRAIPIRKFPRFAAATVQEIHRGVSLNVLEFNGSWAKVQLGPAGATGFIRREFLIAAKETESKVTQISPSMKRTPNATGLASGSTS
ncbi:MAG: hypothetical protein ACREQ2_19735 [Candidatus Binatia bacterium]